jgi:RAB6A-GEF complex partner protein 1
MDRQTLIDLFLQTHLFLPYFLRHSLANVDMPSALSLSHYYSHLSYFPHALEVLLHHVLDDAVDGGSQEELQNESRQPLLPSVISFLQASLPADVYLDIIVQCTRKNEIRSWRTLFAHLPPPKDLFEQALKLKSLKTAAGYLLVLQALDEDEDEETSKARAEDYAVRLLGLAAQKNDWDLCAELSRFLIALDGSGEMLRRTIDRVGLRRGIPTQKPSIAIEVNGRNTRGLGLTLPIPAVPSSLSPRRTQHRRRKGSDMSSITSDAPSNLSPIASKTDDEGEETYASVSEGGSSGLDDPYPVS